VPLTCAFICSFEAAPKEIIGEQDLFHRAVVRIGNEDVADGIDSNAAWQVERAAGADRVDLCILRRQDFLDCVLPLSAPKTLPSPSAATPRG